MLRRIHALAVVAALCLPSALSATEYDLAAYLKKVEADNADLALARQELAEAGQTVIQARSALLPAIGLQGSYTRNLKDLTQPVPVAADLSGGGSMAPLVYEDYDANYDNEIGIGLGVTQKIADAEAIARLAQARKGRDISGRAFEATRRSILVEAKKLYAQTQLAAAVAEVMTASERSAEETYRDIERKYRVGMAKELDLLMAEVDWKSRVPKTAEAQRNADLAMMELKNLAGIPLAETAALTERTDSIPDIPSAPPLDEVLAARADYAIEVLGRELADIAKKASLATFLPTVSASFSYGYGGAGNGSELSAEDSKTMTLGATMTVPLFTGGYRLSLMKMAGIEQRKRDIKILQKKDQIERELLSVALRLETARRGIESARLTSDTAQRAAALAKTAFESGLATQLSVSEANANLDEARLGFLYARFEYLSAYYDWELAVGRQVAFK